MHYLCTYIDGAECALKALGSSWEWLPDGSLKTVTSTVPALRVDDQPASAERSGQKTFFNSLVAAHTGWNDSRNVGERAVVLGEGIGGESSGATTNTISSSSSSNRNRGNSEKEEEEEMRFLDADAVASAVEVMQEVSVAFPWHAGDVLLLDNRTVMHSRQSFQGPRRILASLARDPAR